MTRVWGGDPGNYGSRQGQETYFSSKLSRPNCGPTEPLFLWVLEILSLGVKWMRHESDHSPKSNAELKNE